MSGANTPNLTAPASGSSTPAHGSTLKENTSLPAAFQQPVAGSSGGDKKKGGVFSSDGSFIERFRKLREDELERLKAEEARTKAQSQQERIRNRGRKRPPPAHESTKDAANPEDKEAENEYLKEVKKLKAGSMRDEGSGVKPLMH